MENRYSRQILFSEIGPEGQQEIESGTVVIIGCGALGTSIADNLVRAGVGSIKLIDRDFVELSNLQRQVLFDETDVRRKLPKAVAAAERLTQINSSVRVEPMVVDVNPSNIMGFIESADVVMDAVDNMETRFLINDACMKAGKPWIYGGVVGSYGMTMNIIPDKTACLRCYIENAPEPGSLPTCDMIGILNTVPRIVGSYQATEAMKILMGKDIDPSLIYIDPWERVFTKIDIQRRPECPACGKRNFFYLEGDAFSKSFSLCGRNAIQIIPEGVIQINALTLQKRLSTMGETRFNGFFLSFAIDTYELIIFPDGRTIVKGTSDVKTAKSLYARYVGI